MKWKGKNVCIMVLVFCFLMIGNAYSSAKQFPDAVNHWSEKAITRLATKDVISGYPDGTVRPDEIVTRGQLASILAKSLGLDTSKSEESQPFNDIYHHWSERSIKALVQRGIIAKADYDGNFKPDKPITRIEIIRMMVRASGKSDEAKRTNDNTGFADEADISRADRGYVIIAKQNNIIAGYPDNTLRPKSEATRAEAFQLIDNQMRQNQKLGNEVPPIDGSDDYGSGASSSPNSYPDAQIDFELSNTAHTDTEISISPITQYAQTLKWSLAKETEDGVQAPVDISQVIKGSLSQSGGKITFKESGKYTLTAIAENYNGRETKCSKGITVYPVFIPKFDLSEYSYIDETINITINPEFNDVDIVWTVTKEGKDEALDTVIDGSLTNSGGSITFKEKGTYALTATVTDTTGRRFTCSKEILVYPVISPEFDLPEYTHTDKAVNITIAPKLDGLDVVWAATKDGKETAIDKIIDGSLTSTGGSITFKEKGSYAITATVTDATGRSFACGKEILVYPVPSLVFKHPATAYTDSNIIITQTAEMDGLIVEWLVESTSGPLDWNDYIDGTLDNDGRTIQFKQEGTYQLTAKVTDKTGRVFLLNSESRIDVYPVSDINITLPAKAYPGETVSVNVSGDNLNNLKYQWSIAADGGSPEEYESHVSGTLSDDGGTITFPKKGSYALTATFTDKLGRAFTCSKVITIYPIPDMQISLPKLAYSGDAVSVATEESGLKGLNAVWSISIDGGPEVPYRQYASGVLTSTGGEIRISTNKTIAVKLAASVTDENSRTFTFSSNTISIKPNIICSFTAPSSVHTGESFSVTMEEVSGLEESNITWSLTKDGSLTDYTGSLSNNGGNITINAVGGYTLTAAVTNSEGRIFSYSENIAVTNTAPNAPEGYATVTRTAKDQMLLVNITASATDPDGDDVIYEYEDQSEDGYYPIGSHTVKVRAKDTFGAVSSWTEINFTVAGLAPSTPVITRTPDGNSVAPNKPITITAASTDLDGDTITYVWEGRQAETSAYPLGKNTIRVKAVDSTGMESPWAAIVFFVADSNNGGGMTLSGPESVIVEKGIECATITEYTFSVPPVLGHSGSDYGRVRGYNILTDTWDQLDYQSTANGITLSRKLTAGVYSQLEFYYYTNHDCMYNKSNITYSVSYYFE